MVSSSLLAIIWLGLVKLSLHWLELLLHHKALLRRLRVVVLLGESLVVALRLLLIHHIHISLIILWHEIWNKVIIWTSIIKELRCSSSWYKIINIINNVIVVLVLICLVGLWLPISTFKRKVFLFLLSFLFIISLHGFDAYFSEKLDQFLAFLLFKLNSEFGSIIKGLVVVGEMCVTYFYSL